MKEEDKRNQLLEKTAGQIGNENLLQLLEDNKETVYGKKYQFSEIRNADEYRQKVPLTDYEDYRGYIEDMLHGEENVLTVYPIISYCRTSGTTGQEKYIPVTEEAMFRYSNNLEEHKNRVINIYGGKRLFVNTFRTDLDNQMESPLLFSEIYYRFLFEHGYLNMEDYVGGSLLLFQKNDEDMFYAKVWAAMLTEDLVLMESIFLYDQLCFFHYIEKNWKKVVNGIRSQMIPKEINLPEKVQNYLLSMEVKEERLAHIEEECSKGFNEIVHRLWPELRLVSGISNRAFYSEDANLDKYTGDIPKHYFCYCASECYMGTVRNNQDFAIYLQSEGAFFEFLPNREDLNLDEEFRTLLADELNIGGMYEIVITNFSGLYRYKMGDVVRVTDYVNGCPVFEFLFRKNMALNLAGEKMGVSQIEAVMEDIPEYSSKIIEYCFGVSTNIVPGNYIVLISTNDLQENTDETVIANLIDAALREENTDYNDLREMGRIGDLVVHNMSRDDYMEVMENYGLMDGHRKPKHVSLKDFCME